MRQMNNTILATQAELRFMVTGDRQQQKSDSGLKLLLTGFPTSMPPREREFMIGWMLAQCPEIQQFLANRSVLPPDVDRNAYLGSTCSPSTRRPFRRARSFPP